jgi:homoserine kinase
MLEAAYGDEIHESHRAELSPEVEVLKDVARHAGAYHAARSGAGPSVVAITHLETADRVAAALVENGAMVINKPMETTGLV